MFVLHIHGSFASNVLDKLWTSCTPMNFSACHRFKLKNGSRLLYFLSFVQPCWEGHRRRNEKGQILLSVRCIYLGHNCHHPYCYSNFPIFFQESWTSLNRCGYFLTASLPIPCMVKYTQSISHGILKSSHYLFFFVPKISPVLIISDIELIILLRLRFARSLHVKGLSSKTV